MKKTLLLLTMLSASTVFAGQTLTPVEKKVNEAINEIPFSYDVEKTHPMKAKGLEFEARKPVYYKRQEVTLEYNPEKTRFEEVSMYYILKAEDLKYFCKDMSKEVNLKEENALNAVCLSNILLQNKFKKIKGSEIENVIGIQSYKVREICQDILKNTLRSQVFLIKGDRENTNVDSSLFSECVESITELDTFFKQ
ncbi:MAG: hypothetical protein CL760_01355 [Chloroflexi bacterium]|nr:hypothetical protein [Chloroflexota bacterium]|tara:strand:- start:11021 stop:11605 length:585 start_codon:yes stop_codon:yes gene_type:complete